MVCGGGKDTGDGEDVDSAGPAGVLVDAVDSDVTVVMTLWCGVGSSSSSLIYLEGGTILRVGQVIERLHRWVGENSVLTNPFITTRTGADHKVYQLKMKKKADGRNL